MRKNYYLTIGILFPILLVGCTSEVPVDNQNAAKEFPIVTLYAIDGNANTRSIMNGTGAVKWSETDVINVNGEASTATEILYDGARAQFAASAKAPYGALYPATLSRGYDVTDCRFTVELPSTQPYLDGNSFADGVNPSVAFSKNNVLNFFNLCGIFKTALTNDTGHVIEGVSKVRFISADKPVAGSATADAQTATLIMTGNTKTLDITFDTPQTITPNSSLSVLWVLPPATYGSGTKIQLLRADGSMILQTSDLGTLNVTKSRITLIESVGFSGNKFRISFRPVAYGGSILNAGINEVAANQIIVSRPTAYDEYCSFIGWFDESDHPIVNTDPSAEVWVSDNYTLNVRASANRTFTPRFVKGRLYGGLIWAPANLVKMDGIWRFADRLEWISDDGKTDTFQWNTLEPGTQEFLERKTWDPDLDPCRKVAGGKWHTPTKAEFTSLFPGGGITSISVLGGNVKGWATTAAGVGAGSGIDQENSGIWLPFAPVYYSGGQIFAPEMCLYNVAGDAYDPSASVMNYYCATLNGDFLSSGLPGFTMLFSAHYYATLLVRCVRNPD